MRRPAPGWYVYCYPHSKDNDAADCMGPFDTPEEIFEYLAENEIPYSETKPVPKIYTYYWIEMRDAMLLDYTPVACGVHWRD